MHLGSVSESQNETGIVRVFCVCVSVEVFIRRGDGARSIII